MIPHFSIPEMLIILVIVLLLFGAKRLPEIAGSMGKGIKEFKKQINEAQQEVASSTNNYSQPRLTESDLNRQNNEARPEPKRLID
jgi:sec-independent protein translocase protein TatA